MVADYGRVELRDALPLLDAVKQLFGEQGGVRTQLPDIMEEYGQRYACAPCPTRSANHSAIAHARRCHARLWCGAGSVPVNCWGYSYCLIARLKRCLRSWGLILYRTQLPATALSQGATLDLGAPVHDYASVLVDGHMVGRLDRSEPSNVTMVLPVKAAGKSTGEPARLCM
jgi:beta-galactosidase